MYGREGGGGLVRCPHYTTVKIIQTASSNQKEKNTNKPPRMYRVELLMKHYISVSVSVISSWRV